jgi:phosphoribosylaminoimidazolecarboxamide formyltransferase / IMP cyclohydrolase
MLSPLRRALFSVSDKNNLVEFATELHTHYGTELVATGGTKTILAKAGLPVKDVSEFTNFPEILDGRVKTLHPAVFAGLLAKRSNPDHLATLEKQNLPEFDLVVCNLYPFEETVQKPGVTEAEVIENIDIGGPSMIRAAAKNHASVAVVVNPDQYDELLTELEENDGKTALDYRKHLARAAFARILQYDAAIASYFVQTMPPLEGEEDEDDDTPDWEEQIDLPFDLVSVLRHGENPHQSAALYAEPELDRPCLANAEQLHGKELSYNNYLDLDSALNLVREFSEPAAVVVKHNNACGAATASTLATAFTQAWDGDPLSAFGGIIAFNKEVDVATADALMSGERFVECIIAPDYADAALAKLQGWKKNVRLLRIGELDPVPQGLDFRRIDGGLLIQTRDVEADDPANWKCVTQKQPTPEQRAALEFAWIACKHVKSNAIVLAQGTQLVGVGAGQMSRVMSVEIAIQKAGSKAAGSVLASDAFFPFPDNVELAAKAGVVAMVQPGGSVNDKLSIEACDKLGLAMIFTGIRHFRH